MRRILVDQKMINQYAGLNGDKMWVRVDEKRGVRVSLFGSTSAHGFMILSLLTKMEGAFVGLDAITGFDHMVN